MTEYELLKLLGQVEIGEAGATFRDFMRCCSSMPSGENRPVVRTSSHRRHLSPNLGDRPRFAQPHGQTKRSTQPILP